MSIYSNNRSGIMEMTQVHMNESYKSSDIGTILAETEANDMAIFEAVLYSDFNEIQGLREGTLLEAEAKKLNKESINAFGEKMMTRLKNFLAKIKAMIEAVIEKIAGYCATDGKKIIAAINAHKTGWKGSVENVATYDVFHKAFVVDNNVANIVLAVSDVKVDSKSLISRYLSDHINTGGDLTAKNYTKAALDAAKHVDTYDASNIGELCDILSDGKKDIKYFKDTKKKAEETLNAIAKAVRKRCGLDVVDILTINNRVSAAETIISVITKAGIAAARANISSARIALTKALYSMRKESKSTHEFAIMEAVAELDLAFNCSINSAYC